MVSDVWRQILYQSKTTMPLVTLGCCALSTLFSYDCCAAGILHTRARAARNFNYNSAAFRLAPKILSMCANTSEELRAASTR